MTKAPNQDNQYNKVENDTENKGTLPHQRQTVLSLYDCGIAPDIISRQLDMSREQVNRIIQSVETRGQKVMSSGNIVSARNPIYLDEIVDLSAAIRKAQSRVWKAFKAKPEFTISFEDTQLILEKYAESKVKLVVLHIDIVDSTRLSMTLPVDRLAAIVRSFYQEMSMIISTYGGYVLKYVGDAILAFFLVNAEAPDLYLCCTNAVFCARSMVKVIRQGVNPILNQYDYPEIAVRIGIDVGENTVIQCGWDTHTEENYTYNEGNEMNRDYSNKNDEKVILKKPVYDILGYTISIAAKMTVFAKPDQIVIGELVYESLDRTQKAVFGDLRINTDIWSYVSNNTGGRIYHLFGSLPGKSPTLENNKDS